MIKKRPGKGYQARVYFRGKPVISRIFIKMEDAKDWRADQLADLRKGVWVDPREVELYRLGVPVEPVIEPLPTPIPEEKELPEWETIQLGELIDRFNVSRRGAISEHAWNTDEANLRLHLSDKLKSRPASSITPGEFQDVWTALLSAKSRSTVSRIRNSLSSVFGWAILRHLSLINPIRDARLPQGTGEEDTDETKMRVFPQRSCRRLSNASVT